MVDKLTWKALCALDGLLDQAASKPFAAPNVSLRFVLAYLHWRGAKADSCRDLWNAAHGIGHQHPTPNMRDVIRRGALTTAMHGICRSVGHEYTVRLGIELARARMPKADRDAHRAEEDAYERRKRGELDH